MYFYDTETCGLFGVPIIIQHARDDGPVRVHNIWETPAGQTLELIEAMMAEGVCGYNLTFDHFHLQKIYNMLALVDEDTIPIKNIRLMYEAEADGRFGQCVKPYEVVDLMMNVRKSELQQAMGKKEWRIKKVHMNLVSKLVEYLNRNTRIESYLHIIPDAIWHSAIIENSKGEWIDREWRDIVGRIRSSGGLKPVCAYVFNMPAKSFQEVMPDNQPIELGYIPFAKQIVEMDGWPTKKPPVGMVGEYKGTWPAHIRSHVAHWKQALPLKYAMEDVIWTRKLYEHFDEPSETVDSSLTCTVASCKWRGFDLDTQQLELLRDSIIDEIDSQIIDSRRARRYLMEAMDKFEVDRFMAQDKVEGKTNKPALDQLEKWIEPCDKCLENGWDGCPECGEHEVARRAKKIKNSRKMNAKLKVIRKLLLAERLYPGYNVIGTKSSRMSGSGGLNPQGFDKEKQFRSCFTLGPNLAGGDFDGFELTICDAVYDDPNWHEMLTTGKKVHAIFGAGLYDMDYDDVMADKEKYGKSKSGLFALVYGGTAGAIEYKLEATAEQSKRAEKEFFKNFPLFLKRREEIYKHYRPLKDDCTWEEPLDYIESFMGHRRYFNLEWKICRLLYRLAQDMPFECRDEPTCIRHEKGRVQTVSNALRSALYQSIRQIQKKASRAAINHEIQSPGADITKAVQKAMSDLQPKGIHDWQIQTMNVHDELIAVVHNPAIVDLVERTVYDKIEELKEKVPLLEMEWGHGPTWNAIH